MNRLPEFGKQADVVYRDRPGAYGIILNEAGQVCVLEEKGSFYLPGGALEAGETAEAALERELREELGTGVSQSQPIGCAIDYVTVPTEGDFAKCSYYFFVTLVNLPVAREDGLRLLWLDLDQTIRDLKFPGQRWALKEMLRLRS